MKRRVFGLFAAVILLLNGGFVQAQDYRQSVKAAEERFQSAIAAAKDKYIAELRVLLTEETKRGNIDGALAIREKIGTLEKEFAAAASSSGELESIRGKWVAVAEESQGKRMSKRDLEGNKKTLVIDGDSFTLSWGGRTIRGKINVAASKEPGSHPLIDLEGTLPTGKSVIMRGIYEVKEDTLKIAYVSFLVNGDDVHRPEAFETEEGNAAVSVTYVKDR